MNKNKENRFCKNAKAVSFMPDFRFPSTERRTNDSPFNFCVILLKPKKFFMNGPPLPYAQPLQTSIQDRKCE